MHPAPLKSAAVVFATLLLACTGSQGPEGSAGPQGPTGPQGTPGPQGVPGPSGPPGMAGEAGAPGAPGPTGPPGMNGTNGVNGATGPTGATGPMPIIAPGGGLTGDGTTTAPLAVSFAGSGSAATAARSDHAHAFADLTGTLSASDLPANAFIENQTSAAQAASFRISGDAIVGGSSTVGGAPKSAALSVRGAAPAAGAGTVSTTNVTTTTLNGASTNFTNDVRVNDIIIAGGQRRIVTAITNATTLSVARPFNPQLIGGTTFQVEQPIARFTLGGGGESLTVNGDGQMVAPEVRISGFTRRDDLRISRYHLTCQALAGGTYLNVAAVSPGQPANTLPVGSRLTGTQVCANYVGNNGLTGWTCIGVPYVYEYSVAANGYVGTDVRPTWNICSNPFPDSSNNYHWYQPGDLNTVMMACCVRN